MHLREKQPVQAQAKWWCIDPGHRPNGQRRGKHSMWMSALHQQRHGAVILSSLI